MVNQIPDLWPDDLSTQAASPVAVLRHQAGQLSRRTQGLLEGEIKSRREESEKRLVHEFLVVARALNYTVSLFLAWHNEEMVYPVYIKFKPWDEAAQREYEKTLPKIQGIRIVDPAIERQEKPSGVKAASTEKELIELLRGILTSPHSKSIITSLLARINDALAESESSESASSETAVPAT